jgi:hypothetical protein
MPQPCPSQNLKLSFKRNGTEQVLVDNPKAQVMTELLA